MKADQNHFTPHRIKAHFNLKFELYVERSLDLSIISSLQTLFRGPGLLFNPEHISVERQTAVIERAQYDNVKGSTFNQA